MSNDALTAVIAITVELDTPNGPVIEYGPEDDAETVESEAPAGWRVDWETPSVKTLSGRRRSPLVLVNADALTAVVAIAEAIRARANARDYTSADVLREWEEGGPHRHSEIADLVVLLDLDVANVIREWIGEPVLAYGEAPPTRCYHCGVAPIVINTECRACHERELRIEKDQERVS